ncbi:MAG TPA: beta-glucosidase [Porticoccaceae bacterium]|jgi:beta-glucosidase|nr:beta-glucosidase [Porticoccaceae bacterium]
MLIRSLFVKRLDHFSTSLCVLLVTLFFSLSLSLSVRAVADAPSDKIVETRVQNILKTMTLEQKVGQMVQGEIKQVSPDDVSRYFLGSVLNGGGSFPYQNKQATAKDWLKLADDYYNASIDKSKGGAGIPIFWGTDAVHGHNNIIGATLFPHNIGLGAANAPELIKKIGAITAREVTATGVEWVFAPTVAVVKDNRWGRAYEGYSSDRKIIEAYAGQMVEGLQGESGQLFNNDAKVIATAKHFVGDGGTFRGIDQGDTIMGLDALLKEHGQGYARAIEAGVQTIMASFNSWNGLKIHGDKFLLTDILKDQMGFDGVVVSDWNGVGQVKGCNNKSCPKAINAGIDIVMVPDVWREFLRNTIAQVKDGQIPMARIDDAVSRILRVKIRAGLFEKGAPSSRQGAGDTNLIGTNAHREVAREAVRKSLVLFKNNGDTLPIKPNQHVLITGDGANNIGKQSGGWTISWQGTDNINKDFPGATSIYAGLKQAIESIGGSVELSSDGTWMKRPDVAVAIFGEDPYAEGQGDIHALLYRNGSTADLDLIRSIRSEDIPVVSVVLTGRPLWMNAEINSSNAFVVAWLPGSEGAGVADVLVAKRDGKPNYDFTGRLSFDWPKRETNLIDGRLAVDEYLFGIGGGLSYGDKEVLTATLNEEASLSDKLAANVIFRGSTRSPWKAFVGDVSDWHRAVESGEASTAYGALTVETIDGIVQEDSRQLRWLGGYESQFYWQGEAPVNLSDLVKENGALMVNFRVDKHPEGSVNQRMDCGWPCSGIIDMTEFFRSIPEGQWSRVGISLACFAKIGVELSSVTSPLVLSSKDPFEITLNDVRIIADAPKGVLLPCD